MVWKILDEQWTNKLDEKCIFTKICSQKVDVLEINGFHQWWNVGNSEINAIRDFKIYNKLQLWMLILRILVQFFCFMETQNQPVKGKVNIPNVVLCIAAIVEVTSRSDLLTVNNKSQLLNTLNSESKKVVPAWYSLWRQIPLCAAKKQSQRNI